MNKIAIEVLIILTLIGFSMPPLHSAEKADYSDRRLVLDRLQLAWTLKLSPDRLAYGMVSDPDKGVVYVLVPADTASDFKDCLQINADGKLERQFKLSKSNTYILTARLRPNAPRDLLTFTHWVGSGLVAQDTDGKMLWAYRPDGINDVWAADLDGDGLDEVILGYNGIAGMHVLDSKGKLIWKTRDFANVGRVSAVDVDGDGKLEVIAAGRTKITAGSRSKGIALFGLDGKRIEDIPLPSGCGAGVLRPIQLTAAGPSDGIFVTGTVTNNRFAAISTKGHLVWELDRPRGPVITSIATAVGKPWLVAPCGSILVVDSSKGTVIAKADGIICQESCWLPVKGEEAPLLILKTRSNIYALRVLLP